MLTVLRSPQPLPDSPRAKFAAVLGLGNTRKDHIQKTPCAQDDGAQHSFTRRSVDIVTTHSAKRSHRTPASSPTLSFFDSRSLAHPNPASTPATPSNMPGRNIVPSQATSGRRMRVEDGPWTISAAETPHDHTSFSLYIRSEYTLLSSPPPRPCRIAIPEQLFGACPLRCFFVVLCAPMARGPPSVVCFVT